ncbi:hypothetical protein [Methylocapsa palsarum]|uniref:hypothetical protein n=1 Tax=Methylocapsa palsarum TaxID=1612308 RepID=UPI001587B1D4|nr:hypothetical protein [Methylocapsa palsarum]
MKKITSRKVMTNQKRLAPDPLRIQTQRIVENIVIEDIAMENIVNVSAWLIQP